MSGFKVKLIHGGRITVPLPLRKKLNYQTGDELILQYKDGDLIVTSIEKNLKDLQDMIKNLKQQAQTSSEPFQPIVVEREGDDNV